jgi:Peptidase propeptide and YPEB domain
MKKRTIGATVAGAVLVAGLAGGAVALASGDDEGGSPSTSEQQRVVAAALVETGGGRANAVERDTEQGATWEVEVTKADGTTVDVRLDGNLRLVALDADQDGIGVNP